MNDKYNKKPAPPRDIRRLLRSEDLRRRLRATDADGDRAARRRAIEMLGKASPAPRARILLFSAAAAILLSITLFIIFSKRNEIDLLTSGIIHNDVRSLLARDPSSSLEWSELERTAGLQTLRGPGDDSKKLLFPRGAIRDARPVFLFEVFPAGGATIDYEITIQQGRDEIVRFPASQPANTSNPVEARLPEPAKLLFEREYQWSARIDTVRRPELKPYDAGFQPRPEKFTILPLDIIENEIPKPAGNACDDLLRKSAVLIFHQLASETIEILRILPKDATPMQQKRAALLRARAKALLGDVDGVAKEREFVFSLK